MKRFIIAALLIAAVGGVILSRFPSAAGCRASGRIVDPTGRHCLDATGYVQLREHVIFHIQHVLVLLAVAGALIWAYRFMRRRRARR